MRGYNPVLVRLMAKRTEDSMQLPVKPKPPAEPKTEWLDLGKMRLDGGTQMRVGKNDSIIAEYEQAMRDGSTFPPVIVFFDGEDYWLADGFHRVYAALNAGRKDMRATIRQGTQRDAMLFAAGANNLHGLRRTNADKHRAVLTMLNDPEWGKWSDRQIASACKVSHTFVANVRASTGNVASSRTYERNGQTSTMQVGNIGGSKPLHKCADCGQMVETVQRGFTDREWRCESCFKTHNENWLREHGKSQPVVQPPSAPAGVADNLPEDETPAPQPDVQPPSAPAEVADVQARPSVKEFADNLSTRYQPGMQARCGKCEGLYQRENAVYDNWQLDSNAARPIWIGPCGHRLSDSLMDIIEAAPLGAAPHAPEPDLAEPVISTGPSGQLSFADTVPAQPAPNSEDTHRPSSTPDGVPDILFDLSHRVPTYLRVKTYSTSAAKVIARAARDHGEDVAKLVAEAATEVIKLQEKLPAELKAARQEIERLHYRIDVLERRK